MDFRVYDRHDFLRLGIWSMTAQMTSTRNLDDPGESHFKVNLTYEGINVDGVDFKPLLDIELCDAPTFGDVATTLNSDLIGYASRFGVEPLDLETALTSPAGAQTVSGALVKGFGPKGSTALTSTGCRLPIPQVGSAHFGQFEFRPGDRRVRMLYLKLRSGAIEVTAGGGVRAFGEPTGGDDDGYVVAGAVEGNGSPPF
jgi:hypothetical protein